MYICVCTYIHTRAHKHILKSMQGERAQGARDQEAVRRRRLAYMCICLYYYIYTYTYTHMSLPHAG